LLKKAWLLNRSNIQGFDNIAKDAFIHLGEYDTNTTDDNPKLTFILGSNITIQGYERAAGTANNNYARIFYICYNGHLVMEPGSAITGFKYPGGHIALLNYAANSMRILGGSITNTSVYTGRGG
jgi:hypothetical protein